MKQSRSKFAALRNLRDKASLAREMWQKLKGFKIASLPEKKRTQFSLTREEMKNWIWLKPQLVAQVEFTEWTPDGHLRHSKLVGLRDDKHPREVVREESPLEQT